MRSTRERNSEAEEVWPHSNVTSEPAAEEGFSRAPQGGEASPSPQVTAYQDFTYVGSMGLGRPRGHGIVRGATRVCAYGKHKKIRPPMVNVGEPRPETSQARSVSGSMASSQRSSVYKTALLDAQAETQRALAGIASTRAECNEQNHAIVENIRTMPTTMREGLQISDQLRTAQNVQGARVDALGHRMGEMNDMLSARELRVETQINDLSNQVHTVLNAINVMRREKSLPRQPNANEGVQAGSSAQSPEQPLPNQAIKSELASALKPSTSRSALPETRGRDPVFTVPKTERKPTRVQMR